jgi:Putative peptidoglycan binding domain
VKGISKDEGNIHTSVDRCLRGDGGTRRSNGTIRAASFKRSRALLWQRDWHKERRHNHRDSAVPNPKRVASYRRNQFRTLQSLNLSGKSSSVASSQPASKPTVTHSNTARPDQSAPVEQNRSQQQHQPVTPGRQLQMNPSMPGFGYPSAPVRINKRVAVAEVQRQLITRGYYWGRVDGRDGRQTAFALREFQIASGLPPTGHIDMSTVEALGLPNSNLAYFDPTHRSREVWVPITKFKHGKWKVKWKKSHRADFEQYANEDRGDGYDVDSRESDDRDE